MSDTDEDVRTDLLVERIEDLEKRRVKDAKPFGEAGGGKVDLKRLTTIPEVFQIRQHETPDEAHVGDLVGTLKRVERLDPILVIEIEGEDLVVVDGHHRVEAYRRAKITDGIPTVAFTGTIKEALAAAGNENARCRKPMSQSERLEAAWRLVCTGAFSKREIAETAGVGISTIGNMRSRWRKLGCPTSDERQSWACVRSEYEASWNELTEEQREDLLDQKAEVMREKLAKAVPSGKLTENLDVTARALEKLLGGLSAPVGRYLIKCGEDAYGLDEDVDDENDDF